MEKYTIDAKGKKIGRVATDAAHHLMGKHTTTFARNTVMDIEVEIVNAAKVDIHPKKFVQKEYKRYSGYPGGLKHTKLQDVIAKKGYEEVLRTAVYGMLPGNKLRPILMKKLTVTD
jgi:large subunit ribosomal protein L13